MRSDVEGILGINKNRGGLGSSGKKDIEREVANLLHDKDPFAKSIEDNNKSGQPATSSEHNRKHSHSHSHNHSHSHSRKHRHAHGHGHSHKHKKD